MSLRTLRSVSPYAALLILSAGASGLQAQAPPGHAWDAVKQLRTGERVAIELAGSRRQTGEFANALDESLVVRAGTRTLAFPRSEIRRVGVQGPSKRLRNLALGAAVGAAGGLLSASASGGQSERGFVAGVNTLIGLGIGAGVGASLPADRYRTIYSADIAEHAPPPLVPREGLSQSR